MKMIFQDGSSELIDLWAPNIQEAWGIATRIQESECTNIVLWEVD